MPENGKLAEITRNIERVIVGKGRVVRMVLAALISEGHVLVDDVPGTGKTTLCKTMARSIGGEFRRIQFTPDVLPSDVTGVYFFDQRTASFEFRPGPVFANLVLADEINRATPRTQSALLEAMEERHVTVDGTTHRLPNPFMVIATQNPVELEGTFQLPEAQLDRFMLKVSLGYPSEGEENEMVSRFEGENPLESLSEAITTDELVELQAEARRVRMDSSVREYAVRMTRATRAHPSVQLGASPRATLALCRIAQSWALLDGRSFVIPEDVKEMAGPVLSHRIFLDPQHRIRGRSTLSVIDEVAASTPVPIEERPTVRR
ncbi:MAG TPA: MoxR family ATPase [Chloroflexota bacterium]